MRICVGTIGSSPGWEELLHQEGVPFVPNVKPEDFMEDMSALVVCRHLTDDETASLRQYLRRGGGVLGCAGFMGGLVESGEESVRLRYIQPDEHAPMKGLSLMDLECQGRLSREANCFRTPDNAFAVFAGALHGGIGVIVPFDPGSAMEEFRATERYFYARPERLPSERVSRVAKGELLHFVHASLQYLHHARGLLYAHLSYFPAGSENLFAFRIDTDAGTRKEIDALHRIAAEYELGFSWFVDARSHEPWLSVFKEMRGQEVGLHCYEHRVFLDVMKDADNIMRGRLVMERAGIPVSSFAAPFGFWSPDLGRTIDEAGFAYSSEFSCVYDALPQRPIVAGKAFRTLQVPVHPVSIGTLRRAGFTSSQMSTYYSDIIEQKLTRREPLFFYHHPGHREWDVVRGLCELVRSRGIRGVTLGEYASWWERRGALLPEVTVTADRIDVHARTGVDGPEGAVCLSKAGGNEAILALGGSVAAGNIQWRRVEPYQSPADINRVREFDLRGLIGRQFTRLQRRLA